MHWFSTADEVKHFELKGGFLQPVMSKDKKYKLLNFLHNMERLRAKKFYFYVPDTEETKNENHLIKRSWLSHFWTQNTMIFQFENNQYGLLKVSWPLCILFYYIYYHFSVILLWWQSKTV